MRFERELENLGGTRRDLENLRKTWKISEGLGKSQRDLENLRETWKISERLGKSQRDLENLREIRKISERFGETRVRRTSWRRGNYMRMSEKFYL